MIDKSVRYEPITMRRDPGTPPPDFELPAGYGFVYYKPGDEIDWARIEASVDEFDCEADALNYFQRDFVPYGPELSRRCIFAEDRATGEKIATAMAWWGYTGVRRDPMMHWVAVKPERQGLGVGKALISRVTKLMIEIEGDRVFYLHTQTWSHKAVRLYLRAGFYITDEEDVQAHPNKRTAEAKAILRTLGINV